jgi:hypothetical protein
MRTKKQGRPDLPGAHGPPLRAKPAKDPSLNFPEVTDEDLVDAWLSPPSKLPVEVISEAPEEQLPPAPLETPDSISPSPVDPVETPKPYQKKRKTPKPQQHKDTTPSVEDLELEYLLVSEE